jgi:hypothetical protein
VPDKAASAAARLTSLTGFFDTCAFSGCPVDYCYEVHPGAEHGYALPDRDIHNKGAANRDWELIFAMFRLRLSA